MNKIKALALSYILLPALTLAAGLDEPGVGNNRGTVETASDVIRVFERIANWIFTIFLIGAVIAILVSAFKFLNAGSGPDKASEAKRMLAYAAVAIAIALLANAFPFIIQSIINGGSTSGQNPGGSPYYGEPF